MRKAPDRINRIGGIQLFTLMQYVQANYTQAGLPDPEFAAKAQADLGFPVSRSNIHGCREAFGIKSTLFAQREERAQPATRLARIEARLDAIETWLRGFDQNWQEK